LQAKKQAGQRDGVLTVEEVRKTEFKAKGGEGRGKGNFGLFLKGKMKLKL